MENLKQKTLALFFTRGISLKNWQETGNFGREIAPYKELAKIFKDIYFFTYGREDDLKYQEFLPENIKIFPKKWNLPSILYSLFLPFLYQKELKKADVLKTNQMAGSWAAVLAKWLYKTKLIVRCGYEWLKVMEKEKKPKWKVFLASFLEKLSYRNADKIIVTSFGNKDFIEKRFKIARTKIEVVPNYIDIELFKPIEIEKEKNRICFVGRLSPEKNLSNLIKAISGFKVKLVIFGSGRLKDNLAKLAERLNCPVEFRGNVPNNQLPEELGKSELFILPSFYEGNPKVLLEAMACGLPCIGTKVDGIKEIIRHKENGYLCETDIGSIKRAILEVLSDENLKRTLAENARQTMIESFSFDKILEKEIEIYQLYGKIQS